MTEYVEDFVLDKVMLDALKERLTDEERDILELHYWHDASFDEIGQIIGDKYRGKPLTGSAIRYHKKNIILKLRVWLGVEEED